jgi:membrane associated rhomboid family serine protease
MKSALVLTGLFVFGALVAGLTGLYIALPNSTTPCGDECGARALVTALQCAVGGALVSVFGGVFLMRYRRRSRP